MTTCCCSLSQGVADSLKDMSPEQMQSMMKWATRAQRCMGVCGAPFKALSWVRERIPLPAPATGQLACHLVTWIVAWSSPSP